MNLTMNLQNLQQKNVIYGQNGVDYREENKDGTIINFETHKVFSIIQRDIF